MKSIGVPEKDVIYSLQNTENYNLELTSDINEVVKKYSQLIVEYFSFIHENIKIKKSSLFRFIIIRGLDTITNVFNYILFSTKNLDLTYFHCQKSFYFYVEFVGQISEDEKSFLQLTSRDATTYVYKKTIYEIKNDYKKINQENPNCFREKICIIEKYIKLYQIYLLKIIQTENINILNMEYLIKIYSKLNNLVDNTKISELENITQNLYYKINNDKLFLEINYLLIKKIVKNQKIIEKISNKIISDDFDIKILETPEKFIIWLTS